MASNRFQKIDTTAIETPFFLVHEGIIQENADVLKTIQTQANCTILLALKGFAMKHVFPILRPHLGGICASGLYEARLGFEAFQKEVHTYSPAFKESEFDEINGYSDYIIFNSITQFQQLKNKVRRNKKDKMPQLGLRVNPQTVHEDAKYVAYNPCGNNSRLGIVREELESQSLEGITGLHFHALCEQDSTDLEEVLKDFDAKFGKFLPNMEWVNFGGGHLITSQEYDKERLVRIIQQFRGKYPNIKSVYLEPGEAVALKAGVLVAKVIDILDRENKIAILDISVECHLPDVLITRHDAHPYVPEITQGVKNRSPTHTNKYLVTGNSCAAGDVIGDYYVSNPLRIGDQIMFLDAAHYSMVKTTTFNGIALPTIVAYSPDKDKCTIIRKPTFDDYKDRI